MVRRVLTVDDSRAIRAMVTKQVSELGFQVDEAEHGQEGLARLEAGRYDLVLLDLTMPVLDGPGMLARMRGRGDMTPVLMLTSESKSSIVSAVMKHGIEGFVLKPFKPEELRQKLVKALKLDKAAVPTPPPAEPHGGTSEPAPGGPSAPGKTEQPGDVLVIDDMDTVEKRLRRLLPPALVVAGATSAPAALAACRERPWKAILLDTEIPGVSSAALLGQLRALAPQAVVVALALRGGADADAEAKAGGYDGVLFKPFQPEEVEDFLATHFDNQDLLQVQGDVARMGAFGGREDRIERYFRRIEELLEPFLHHAAAACYEAVVLDASQAPVRPDRTPRMLLSVMRQARRLGVELRLVGTPELAQVLRGIAETAAIPFFGSAEKARPAA